MCDTFKMIKHKHYDNAHKPPLIFSMWIMSEERNEKKRFQYLPFVDKQWPTDGCFLLNKKEKKNYKHMHRILELNAWFTLTQHYQHVLVGLDELCPFDNFFPSPVCFCTMMMVFVTYVTIPNQKGKKDSHRCP